MDTQPEQDPRPRIVIGPNEIQPEPRPKPKIVISPPDIENAKPITREPPSATPARPLPLVWIAGIGLAALGLIVVIWVSLTAGPRSPGPNAQPPEGKTATWNYWEALRDIGAREKELETKIGNPKTPKELSARLSGLAGSCRSLAEEIAQLPVRDVDVEVVDLGAKRMRLLLDAGVLISDLVGLYKELDAFIDASNSFEKFLESFLRGFFGDPLGANADIQKQLGQFDRRRLQLAERMTALQYRDHELDQETLQLRARLTQKYQRDFPALSPPRLAK